MAYKLLKKYMLQLTQKGFMILRPMHYFKGEHEGYGIAQYTLSGGWQKYDKILYGNAEMCIHAMEKLIKKDKNFVSEASLENGFMPKEIGQNFTTDLTD